MSNPFQSIIYEVLFKEAISQLKGILATRNSFNSEVYEALMNADVAVCRPESVVKLQREASDFVLYCEAVIMKHSEN